MAIKGLNKYLAPDPEFQKTIEWCRENCDGVYGFTKSELTIDFFLPIGTKKEKAPNGEPFPPSKVTMEDHYFLFFEDDGDATKFILTWSGEDK